MHDLANSPLRSRAWRLQNLYTIRDADGRLVKFKPNLAQRTYYNTQWIGNHVLKARKLGFSTFFEIENLDFSLFSPGTSAGIIDVTLDDATDKLDMVRLSYENLDNGDIHPDTWRLGKIIKAQNPLVEDTAKRLVWANDSKMRCSTSLRGATPQRIHWSEAGKTAIFFPKKAKEIINGALNSITPGNVVNIESTHEGGRIGAHYNLLRSAMRQQPAELTPVDRKFHFFPWWKDPRYALPGKQTIRPEIEDYFQKLTEALQGAHHFTPEQILWYDRKQEEQKHGMKKEFPSTAGECFEAISDHAIYGVQMANLRAGGRILDFGCELDRPLFTFWDIGLSDFTSIWLIQPVGRWFLVLDWLETEGSAASSIVDCLTLLERKWQKPIAVHFLPHDAAKRSPNDGKSYQQALADAGLHNLKIVPRTPDVWLGIGYVRDILPHCYFHATHCDTPRDHNGEEYPSGIACLEGYQKNITQGADTLREAPKHDAFSHSADAFRTFAEAWRRGMVAEITHTTTPKATGGIRKPRSRR